jgi:PKD domain-containing protein
MRLLPALPAVLCCVAALAAPSAASAAFFVGEPVDGPSPEIRSLGDVDVARDGTGALAYVKRDGGVDHIFVSRLLSGMWQPPERIDAGLPGDGSEPVVAASDGGRLAIAFVSGGQLYTVVRANEGTAYTVPAALAGGASHPAIDMSFHGAAYVSYTVAPGDVRVARLDRRETAFVALGDVLDITPAAAAGDGSKRSRIAVSADATALVVWGEDDPDGRTHVWGRRVFDARVSTAPQDLTLADFQGHRAGAADAPDVDIEDDSSFAWAVFRQRLDDGRAHVFARRLVGSQFEPPVSIDGLGLAATENATAPRIELNGRGEGLATAGTDTSFSAFGAVIHDDVFAAPVRLGAGTGIDPLPAGGVAESGDTVVAWQQRDAGVRPSIQARFYDNDPASRVAPEPGPVTGVSNPDLGPVDAAAGFDVASNRVGDVVMVFVQGESGAKRIVSASYDRPPQAFTGYTTTRYRRFARPTFSWQPAFDLWGPVAYRVEIDGRPVGETTDTRLTVAQVVPDGRHLWRVVATDRHGQTVASRSRLLRIDATPPALTFRVRGERRRGKVVRVQARAADVLNPFASGIAYVRIRFGDGTPTVTARSATHRYAHRGRYTIRVSATDRAGNATVVTRRIRVKK